MGAVIFIDDTPATAGGSDVTPAAVNWADITVTGTTGYEHNAAQTITAIDAPIVLRASWTSTSSDPAKGQWIKNGVAVADVALTPVDVNVTVNDSLYFSMYCSYTFPAGNYDTGTVTVKNVTDANTTIDTFAFAVQFVYSGSGSMFQPPGGGRKQEN